LKNRVGLGAYMRAIEKKYTKLCYIAEANDQQIGRVAANGLEM